MYSKFKKAIEIAYDKKIDATGLGLFRISFFLVLLFEVKDIFFLRHLYFDEVPFLSMYEIDFGPILVLWMMAILMVVVGYKTRLALLLNYLLSFVCIGTIDTYEYHMFYAYMGAGLMALFLPVGKSLSVDSLLARARYASINLEKGSSKGLIYARPKISVLSYTVFIFVGIGLVYFDSVFHKLSSFHWSNGLGVWYPSSIPQIVIRDFTPILNMKWAMLFSGYLILVFEAVFIFIFWFKWSRIPLALIGIGLHVGIYLVYPIPYFALGVTFIYILFVPVKYWVALRKKFSGKGHLVISIDFENQGARNLAGFLQALLFFKTVEVEREEMENGEVLRYKNYSGALALRKVLQSGWLVWCLGWLSKPIYRFALGYDYKPEAEKVKTPAYARRMHLKWIPIALIVVSCLQLLRIYESPSIVHLREVTGLFDTGVDKFLVKKTRPIKSMAHAFAGITAHPVFMDQHFQGYDHIIGIKHGDTFVPVVTENGMAGAYLRGGVWIKWTFRSNGPVVIPERLESGIRDFTAFWAKSAKVDLADAEFEIVLKKTEVPGYWEEDFLKRQLEQPWMHMGTATWKDEVCSFDIDYSLLSSQN